VVNAEDCHIRTHGLEPAPVFFKPKTCSDKLYIQSARDVSRFRAVSSGETAQALGNLRSSSTPARATRPSQFVGGAHLDFTMGTCAPDLDVIRLRTDITADSHNDALLICCCRCQSMACLLCHIAQIILAGLSLVSGMLVLGAGEDGDMLEKALLVLEPGFSRTSFALAQFACIASVLQAIHVYDTIAAIANLGALEMSGVDFTEKSVLLGKGWWSLPRPFLNMCFLLCCLVAGRMDIILLSTSAPHFQWQPHFARGLLAARAVLGLAILVASVPAMLRLLNAQHSSLLDACPTLLANHPGANSMVSTGCLNDNSLCS